MVSRSLVMMSMYSVGSSHLKEQPRVSSERVSAAAVKLSVSTREVARPRPTIGSVSSS